MNNDMTLERKTQEYWKIQSGVHGRGGKHPTTQEVLMLCSKAAQILNPARPLAFRFAVLQHEVVVGKPRAKDKDKAKTKDKEKATIYHLTQVRG